MQGPMENGMKKCMRTANKDMVWSPNYSYEKKEKKGEGFAWGSETARVASAITNLFENPRALDVVAAVII